MTRDSTTSEEKSSRSYWGFVLWPVAVVVLYVLSVGPATLAARKKLVPPGLLCIYEPFVEALMGTPLERPMGKYLHLWGSANFDEDGDFHP